MPYKIFSLLLIIFGIWYREITGTFANEEIRETSDNLLRQKRVVNHIQGENQTVLISSVPYIVKIKHNLRFICVGSILSQHVVITAALCVPFERQKYYVLSNSARLERGDIHTVTDVKMRFGHHPNRPADGIALLTVNPPFVYESTAQRIELHSEPLLPGTVGTISGWGYNVGTADHGICNLRNLRSIQVPIMAHRECVNRYRPVIQISDVDICTYHPQKYCGHTDGGAPLVVDGYLAGVHLWTGPGREQHDPDYPDVFAVMQHSAYNQWIRENI